MSRTPEDKAALLTESAAFQDGESFARRAAACYLLAGFSIDGFDAYRVWPAALKDFLPGDAAENAKTASVILAAARGRRRAA